MIEGNQPPMADRSADQTEGEQRKRWQGEFPYHWDADDLVTRRELLQFAVYTSGALWGGTALLALLGLVQQPVRTEPQPVANVNDVPEGEAVYFNYPDPDDQAMLLHLPGGEFVAYRQKCTHLSCAVYHQPEQDRLYCPCHEGVFDVQTGEPTAGPPQRALPRIVLERQGDMLMAVGVDL
jgi:Rieske Fe-S protein